VILEKSTFLPEMRRKGAFLILFLCEKSLNKRKSKPVLCKMEKMKKRARKMKKILKTTENPSIMVNAVTLIAVKREVAVTR
jgi:hypothetical protein